MSGWIRADGPVAGGRTAVVIPIPDGLGSRNAHATDAGTEYSAQRAAANSQEGETLTIEANKATYRRFCEAWDNREFDRFSEFIAPDLVLHMPRAEVAGIAGLRQIAEAGLAASADRRTVLEALVAEGDMVVCRYTSEGTHTGEFQGIAPTGRRWSFEGFELARFAGGRIAEAWGVRDELGLMQQMGVGPAASQQESVG